MREKRLLCIKNKSKRIKSYIISKKNLWGAKKAKKTFCKKNIIFCTFVKWTLMICKPFCRSRDADSEYTKHYWIWFKNKGDSLGKLGCVENLPGSPKIRRAISHNTYCIMKKQWKIHILTKLSLKISVLPLFIELWAKKGQNRMKILHFFAITFERIEQLFMGHPLYISEDIK